MKYIATLYILMLTLTLSAQDMTIDQIVLKANETYRYLGDDVKSTALMEIKDASGKTVMTRELIILRKDMEGFSQKWYAYFTKPADIKKMVFMAWKNDGGEDDRWLYLPALDLVKRLSGADKRSSFAGSQFAYEDVTGRDHRDDTHVLLGNDGGTYHIKSTPKDAAEVEFAYYESWVDKKTFLPKKTVLYDKSNKAYKQFDNLETTIIQGYPTLTKFSMTDLRNGESSVATMSDIEYNIGLPDNVFSEAYLRRAPRKYLR